MAMIELPVKIYTEQEKNEAMVRKLLSESARSLIDLAKKHKELFDIFGKIRKPIAISWEQMQRCILRRVQKLKLIYIRHLETNFYRLPVQFR